MKVVLNKDYGGFGLSNAALIRLLELGSPHITLMPPIEYYGDSEGWQERFKKEQRGTGMFSVCVINGKILVSKYRTEKHRTCPFLIQVVEDMGNDANGSFSCLEVIEIPDGIEFEIDEYDGIETAHQVGTSW